MRGLAVALAAAACACGFDPLDRCRDARAGDELSCPMPGYLDRAFDLEVPAGWDGSEPLPLLYAFHGGGGNRAAAERITCPGGDLEDPGCLSARANAAGYAVVRPDGTGSRPTRNIRTWNAGGGTGDWQCVSGPACKAGAEDMAYLDDLHAELERLIPIDGGRVYATGLSNGAAITHRFACERPRRLAAVAPIAGNNQHAAAGGACAGGVALLQIHGSEDPCWSFETTSEACLQEDGLKKVGVDPSLAGWRERNQCGEEQTEEALPDPADDGTRAARISWSGCAADVELIRIEGGGHTWPGGYAYLGEDRIGRVSRDFDADDLILEFFDAHAR